VEQHGAGRQGAGELRPTEIRAGELMVKQHKVEVVGAEASAASSTSMPPRRRLGGGSKEEVGAGATREEEEVGPTRLWRKLLSRRPAVEWLGDA
jgi:hypothetical protein